jgi:tetratricopeptide (TPR) repeat protein
LKQGRVEEGESEMRRALTIDTRYGPAYLNLARSLLGRGKAVEAVNLLIDGTRLVPADADMQTFLGEAYLRLGQKEKAVAAFESSLRLRPNQAEIRQKLKSIAAASSERMKSESAPPDKP